MSLSQTSVGKLYATVIEDVISGVREFFLDEGVDEQVLVELKNSWVTRLQATKALVKPDAPEPQPPALKQAVIMNNQPVQPQPQQQQQQQQQLQQPQQQQPQHQQLQPQPQPQTQQPQQQPAPAPVPVELPKNVSIQITLPAQQGVPDAQPRAITIQVPATALQGNQLQSVLTGPIISATMALPPHMATALLQQHVTASLCGQNNPAAGIIQVQAAPQQQTVITSNVPQQSNGQTFQNQAGLTQLDGQNDTSDEDEDDDDDEDDVDDDDEDDADDKEDEENDENEGPEEEPLNSGDDVSEEDPLELFETDNVVVCQYDKITRTRNKWKFYLKDGIMNLGGKDYVFQKSNGDAEW